MRELTKNQIYEMLDMMQEAMEYRGSTNEMMTILIDCQNAAVQTGEIIENEISPEHTCIKYLEEYVEIIFRAGNCIDDRKQYTALMKQGKKLLLEVKNQIRYRIDKTCEILFLPYKASMWDCFDSIYRAIRQEGKHHPVVMPIPYYSLDSQQKVIKSTYEGENLPADIDITDYRLYSLEERRPDVILIHNPYDNYNLVTRVPEKFFSSELIKVTKHLVYIPYLVRSDTTIPDHYVLMPGVINAWRVYVQSEDIKKSYLEHYPFGNKIVAMGSPKIDMVLRTNEQEKMIPGEWKEKLWNRKVFLYNTHLHDIMNYSDKLLEEYDYVLNEFAKRDDIALLWRPHPLTLETIRTFRPQILDDYTNYLMKAELCSNVVIDKSADLHKAIALSDAYLGNYSSLIELFGVTGKPIFIISQKKISVEELSLISFRGCAVDGTDMWVSDINKHGLCRIDMATWRGKYVSKLPIEDLLDPNDINLREIVKIRNKILIVASERFLFIYNVDTGLMDRIDLNTIINQGPVMISNAFTHHDEVWLFPALCNQPLLIYNCLNDSVRIDGMYDKIKNLTNRNRDSQMSYYGICVREEQYVWHTIRDTDKIIRIDMNGGDVTCYEISEILCGAIAWSNGILWMLNDIRNTLIKYDPLTHSKELFRFRHDEKNNSATTYGQIIAYDDYVYILPWRVDTIVIFDKKQLNFSYFTINQEDLNPYSHILHVNRHFYSSMVHPGGIHLYPMTHKGILRLDCSDGEWTSEIQLIHADIDSLKKWLLESKEQVYFSESYLLSDFIERVSKSAISCKERERNKFFKYLKSMDSEYGESIWKDIRKAL